MSDNGGALRHGASNGTLNGQKGDLLEGGVRIPMCMSWGDKLKAGTTVDDLTMITDCFPTFVTLAHTQSNVDTDGVDLTPLILENESLDQERVVYFLRRGNNSKCSVGNVFYGMQKGPWKMVQNSTCEPFVFYNMKTDWNEQKPISVDEMPKKYKNFQKLLTKHVVKTSTIPWQKAQD